MPVYKAQFLKTDTKRLVNGIIRKRIGLFNVHHDGKLIHERLWIPRPDDFKKTPAGVWIEYEAHRSDFYPVRYQVLEQPPDDCITVETPRHLTSELPNATDIFYEGLGARIAVSYDEKPKKQKRSKKMTPL
jgi:hypothetical protein